MNPLSNIHFRDLPPLSDRIAILVRGEYCADDPQPARHREELRKVMSRFLKLALTHLSHPTVCLPLASELDVYIARLLMQLREKERFDLWLFPDSVQLMRLPDAPRAVCDALLEEFRGQTASSLDRGRPEDYSFFAGESAYCLCVVYGEEEPWARVLRRCLSDAFTPGGDLRPKHIELHTVSD